MKLTVPATLSAGAIDTLMSYNWPGNVRELENAVERALILNQDQPLVFNEIYFSNPADKKLQESSDSSKFLDLDTAMTNHICQALEISGGKVEGKNGAAQLLNINPGTLRHRMRKLGIPFGGKGVSIREQGIDNNN